MFSWFTWNPKLSGKTWIRKTMRVPKRPFVFSQQNTKFYSCTQTAIRFLQRNTKSYSCTQTAIRFFYSEIRNLELYPNGHLFLVRNTKFLNFFRNFNLLFDNKLKKLKLPPNCLRFLNTKCKIGSCTQTVFRFWIQTAKI